MSLMLAIALAALAGWLVLAASGFWTCRVRDDTALVSAPPAAPAQWPAVVAVVPARDEADVIATSLAQLAAQDYPGPFRIILVDDNSSDGTGDVALGLAGGLGAERLSVVSGAPLPPGWTGKLWALNQGIAEAGAPAFLWLTDADIAHAPGTLRRLVGIAQAGDRRLVSLMALLHCEGVAEAALIPAFVWFFMMLYPFNWVNRPGPFAGAAGGCVLIEARALAAAGGIAAMRGALIDDCTLGALIKRQGPIWLGLTRSSRSLRPYQGAREIGGMIARSAYAQLRYNPLLLAGTLAGLGLMFGVPLAALAQPGLARLAGGLALVLMFALYQPLLRFYRRSPLWALALPAIAAFYAGCTVASALAWYRGRGGAWKGRAQAMRGAA